MLDAGLTTVLYLKSRILPEAGRARGDWDEALAKLGLSVAERLQQHCNRDFARQAGVVELYQARTLSTVVRRYPVESIGSISLRDANGSERDCPTNYQLHATAGLIDWIVPPGARTQRLRITYTGGYWLDPWDETPMPSGATALPDDVLEAFVIQCQHLAEARGLFEAISLRRPRDGAEAPRTETAGLLDDVTDVLRPYRRFAGE